MGDALPGVLIGGTVFAVGANGNHTCAVFSNGTARCWGHNSLGQLGLGDFSNRGDAPGEMGAALPAVKLFSDLW